MTEAPDADTVLGRFTPATREWFAGAFPGATPAQLGAWDAISSGKHALVVAPTGSGKTLASFLWAIDRFVADPTARAADAARDDAAATRTRVIYVSPLKALGVDVERNLRAPLIGVTATAARLGTPTPPITVGVRSGDTPTQERRALQRTPPDILITTPESLYLMLTSSARETLSGVTTVIVDEVHAVAGTKRGAHLALTLERLDARLGRPVQRIGLSATVRPVDEVARFLGGQTPVQIVQPPSTKTFDLTISVPVDDMTQPPLPAGADDDPDASGAPANPSIWPHVEESIVDRVLEHRSTIVFVNSRRLAERLTARLNEIYAERASIELPVMTKLPAQQIWPTEPTAGAPPLLARAHHGSVSKDQRADIEDELKSGRLRCVVATSSLELGIDMGAVDLVIQVESPPSVASALQRIGRAGHQVGEVSRGVLVPKHRMDVLHAAVTGERMLAGLIEELRVPANPLDVLAQQTVAHVALEPCDIDEWFDQVRRSAPFASLPRSAYDAVLDLLSGRYPSDRFAELRPRIVWDRVHGTLTGRPGAQRLAVTSGGTIPDRGLFGVFLAGDGPGRRVGELDEEMVYESRVGDVIALGATSWRIDEITRDRVIVTPAFGQPGKVPFWKGDGLGRPAELGRALGATTRELGAASSDERRIRLAAAGLDERAVTNLEALLIEQTAATGHLPSDTTLVVERFRDELGDWRLVMHSPYGLGVHAPWALAVSARIRERYGVDGAAIAADDGVVVRLPDTDSEPPGAELLMFDADELTQIVTAEAGGSALFASRFRECAARALLLPRRDPGRRSPLWQQRQRAGQLLEVAQEFPDFPITLETLREVLSDVYDLDALITLATQIAQRAVRVVEVETPTPSPFARSLLFGYVAAFLYEGDSPLAERRAAALSIDSTLLAELLGRAELREVLDAKVIAEVEAELQRLAPDRRAKDAEGVADLLRILGPLSADEVRLRAIDGLDVEQALTELTRANRAIAVTIAAHPRFAAVEDAARLRDALGTPVPIGVPTAFLDQVPDPVGDLVARYARTHGPFALSDVAERYGMGSAVVRDALRRLGADRRVIEGEYRPDATGSEWIDAEVLRRLRTRSLAALRKEIEPVSAGSLGRFMPAWQHVGGSLRGIDGVLQTVEQLQGVALPASAWESLVLPARVRDYSPAWLDELTASGEVVWAGEGSLPGNDGWLSLHLAELAPLSLKPPLGDELTERQQSIVSLLEGGGGFFFRQLAGALHDADDAGIVTDLWSLVWSGHLTNDTIAPARALLGSTSSRTAGRRRAPRARSRTMGGYARPSGSGMRGSAATGASALSLRTGPPTAAGRWALLPERDDDVTRRTAHLAETLLERHGVVTRGAAQAEDVAGGFALLYKVLAQLEEAGRVRRGYFVDHLGAAQFGTPATVDRLRTFTRDPDAAPALQAVVLAATDPANPYGAALPWPDARVDAAAEARGESTKHRPGRKAGSLVALVDGHLAVYLERGGKSALAFTDDEAELAAAAAELAATVRARLRSLRVERVNQHSVFGTVLADALTAAGFVATPQGLRLRV
ncbi:Lhr family ATP dependent helicase [Microcella putealis]|uniref:Lhr family ATP dependent helicase n=1 Tax=Microcella putealis TaxID=337005 RepID=A0A4Q7LS10_9MICO|nr:ATP-dependent helicase [Microcella putealis]RZS56429.1 Lhr family ATP dependent helicase [Microcella putealis]TQM27085.1 Lhr family ATP dependent helicase [Microcella putealis]